MAVYYVLLYTAATIFFSFIEAYLFLVNILHYGSVLCIVIHCCKNFFSNIWVWVIISCSLHYQRISANRTIPFILFCWMKVVEVCVPLVA